MVGPIHRGDGGVRRQAGVVLHVLGTGAEAAPTDLGPWTRAQVEDWPARRQLTALYKLAH